MIASKTLYHKGIGCYSLWHWLHSCCLSHPLINCQLPQLSKTKFPGHFTWYSVPCSANWFRRISTRVFSDVHLWAFYLHNALEEIFMGYLHNALEEIWADPLFPLIRGKDHICLIIIYAMLGTRKATTTKCLDSDDRFSGSVPSHYRLISHHRWKLICPFA